MKSILLLHIIITCFFIISCNNKKATTEKLDGSIRVEESYSNKRDNINKSLKWKELKCGLWINKDNEIGLKSYIGTDEGEITEFITMIDSNKIIDIVDTNTFRVLGNGFFKDKKHIYHMHNHIAYQIGEFYIFNIADYNTFEVIHDCYARDKNNIYEYRGWPIENVDVETFKTDTNIIGCLAKDKNHYYKWGDTITLEDMKDSAILKAIKILNK